MRPIPTLTDEELSEEVLELVQPVRDHLGILPNLVRIAANSPAALKGACDLFTALQNGELDLGIQERIALAVAEANGSEYCLSAHTHIARRYMGLDDVEITANRSGGSTDIKIEVAVKFALTLVRTRGKASPKDIEAVKKAGYSNAGIVEIIALVAFNIFGNYLDTSMAPILDFRYVPMRKQV